MKISIIFSILCTLLMSLPIQSQSSWEFDDAHSNLQFAVTNLMVAEIEGSIEIKKATLSWPAEDLEQASIFIQADINTIDTDNNGRDEQLRSPDFFDAAKYPDVTFQSTTFKRISETKYSVTGNLTFHGNTKSVTMEVTGKQAIRPYDNRPILGFKATGEIKRTDFDISSSTPSAILSDEIQIKANVIFVKE